MSLFYAYLPFIFNYTSLKGNNTHFIFSISIPHGLEAFVCLFVFSGCYLDTNILKINGNPRKVKLSTLHNLKFKRKIIMIN